MSNEKHYEIQQHASSEPECAYSGLIFPFGEIVIPSEAKNLLFRISAELQQIHKSARKDGVS